ncbi:MAG: murein biosynthesis integral membrane protein MurJ [Clostridiales bacterium]|jgi:putative peptidoglycan lipid II flippase|nr:murein biosynthesis integral membrane protein MurJ [Clostridiales bacterium]
MTSEGKKFFGKNISRTVMAMMAVTLLGKLMGVLRDRMEGALLGMDTAQGAAFAQASSLPRNFLDIMFAAVFSASFIPVFNDYLETKGKKAAFDLAALFISVTLLVTATFTVICVIFAEPLYAIFLSGDALPAGAFPLGVRLLRFMFPLIVLSGLAFSLTGILQSLGEFNIPAAMSAVSNGIILIYYFFFFEKFGVHGLCAAFLLGWAAQTAIQVPFLVKHRFPFRFSFNVKDAGLRQIAGLALPVMAATWAAPVNQVLGGKAVALFGGAYDVAAMPKAYNLFLIVSGVFVLSVANVIFPRLSKESATGDDTAFSDTLGGTLRSLFLILLPMTAGMMAMSEPLVRLVYKDGLFDESAVAVTARALFWFSPGIVGYGLQTVLSRACYALRDGKTPVVSAAVAIALNAALCFGLAPSMELTGVAIASSVSLTAAAGVMMISLARKGKIKIKRQDMLALLKMAGLSVLMLAVVLPLKHGLESVFTAETLWNYALIAFIPSAVGAGVYFGGGRVFNPYPLR